MPNLVNLFIGLVIYLVAYNPYLPLPYFCQFGPSLSCLKYAYKEN